MKINHLEEALEGFGCELEDVEDLKTSETYNHPTKPDIKIEVSVRMFGKDRTK